MADNISSAQNTNSTGSTAGTVLRDVNASASLGEFLNGLNSATSSAMTGAVTIGDRIIGGGKNSGRQFGLLQTLAVVAGVIIIFKMYQDGGK